MKIKVISQFYFKEHYPENESDNIFTYHAILYALVGCYNRLVSGLHGLNYLPDGSLMTADGPYEVDVPF